MKKFIVLYTPRTGSTMIWMLLNQHPNIAVVGDMFGRKPPINPYDNPSLARLHHKDISIEKYMDLLIADTIGDATQAFGFKCMYALLVNDLLSWAHKNRPHIIHVERKDLARQYISGKLANARKKYHLYPGEKAKQVSIKVDIKELKRKVQLYAQHNGQIKKAFSEFPYTKVIYEDAILDIEGTAGQLFSFLDVEHISGLRPTTKKITPDNLEKLILNYDRVKPMLGY